MDLSLILQMAADAGADRVALSRRSGGLSYAGLRDRAQAAARWLSGRAAERTVLVDLNSDAVPILLFGSALSGRAFAPLNYRLTDAQLQGLVRRTAPAVVVAGEGVAGRLGEHEGADGIEVVDRDRFLEATEAEAVEALSEPPDPDGIAVMLFTSGTTGDPKAAVLRHRHLVSYVISSVELMGADPDEAALVSVPPYHIAGISAVLTSVYAGRRLVYLPSFDPEAWVSTVADERITHAMVVPTMLGRILDVLDRAEDSLPTLRTLSYGGGPMPASVIERALDRLPHVDFVNAYGLTETSSTIAVLGPEDHRRARASDDPALRARLSSVGRALPGVAIEIRGPDGTPVPAGERGEICVRGEQVAGEYAGTSASGGDGWFPTRDAGRLDADGYLYVEGRLDDVIVRGGENMSPGEIEGVLVDHAAVADAAVVGLPDAEWGERVVAAVVPADAAAVTEGELQDWVRGRLRSSRTPERIAIVAELPYTETGKLLRREVRSQLLGGEG
ncbi:MAG TPA: AMP-binding protein [Acidimicrobiales bacterium]|nr:AMP-binding protein [Acidimicrobiales bacterium]